MTTFAKFRRREARAVNSGNLRWSDTSPADIDYVAARGMSGEKLGALLEALKWGQQKRSYGPAVHQLGKRFHEVTGRNVLKRLVHGALHEWLNDNCRKCGGRGFIAKKSLDEDCKKCNGTGLHQHSDYERAHMASIAVDAWEKHEADYELVLKCLRGAVASHRGGSMRAFGVHRDVELA